jgi:hypothetical protein
VEGRVDRPILLGVVALLAMVQAVSAILGGIALVVEHNDADLLRHVDVSSDTLRVGGWVLLVLGAVQLLVAIGLWRGNNFARFMLAILEVLQAGGGLYILIAYEGSYRWQGLWQLIFALVILYVLFNRRSAAFFESR